MNLLEEMHVQSGLREPAANTGALMPLRNLLVPALLVVVGCGSPPPVPPASKSDVAGALEAVRDRVWGEEGELEIGPVTKTQLKDGTPALSIRCLDTWWELKEGEDEDFQQAWVPKAKRPPPPSDAERKKRLAERRKRMDKFVLHMCVWLVSLDANPEAGAGLKPAIPRCPRLGNYPQEVAYLGRGRGYAWFADAPIRIWIRMQAELGLVGGDDRLEGAYRGLEADRPGRSRSLGTCLHVLETGGPRARAYLDRIVRDRHPKRGFVVGNLDRWFGVVYPFVPNAEWTAWLIRQTASPDPVVAKAARGNLTYRPRYDAMSLYDRWLAEDAGRRNVERLLRTARELELPGLAAHLPQVLDSPTTRHEYRLAYEMQRELRGRPIPAALLDAERLVWKSWEDHPEKVETAIRSIVGSGDEAAALIGMSLATARMKGLVPGVREAGRRILRLLPGGRGRALVAHLARTCEDRWGDLRDVLQTLE